MSFDFLSLLPTISVIVTAIFWFIAMYSPQKKFYRMFWKVVISINSHFIKQGEQPINLMEADEVLVGEIFQKGVELIFRSQYGNKNVLTDIEKICKEYPLVVDGSKFYNKLYVKKLIFAAEDRMKKEAKLKVLMHKVNLKLDAQLHRKEVLEKRLKLYKDGKKL